MYQLLSRTFLFWTITEVGISYRYYFSGQLNLYWFMYVWLVFKPKHIHCNKMCVNDIFCYSQAVKNNDCLHLIV